MLVIRGTKKILDRVGRPSVEPEVESTTALGSWFATVLFWKPQVALFVNARTLLPVFVPFAPATSVVDRFRTELEAVLSAHEVDRAFVDHELAAMGTYVLAKTNSRSVLGSMNDFTFLAEGDPQHRLSPDLRSLSMRLAHTPCGPLRNGTGFPDLELRAVVDEFAGARPARDTHVRWSM